MEKYLNLYNPVESVLSIYYLTGVLTMAIHTLTMYAPSENPENAEYITITPQTELWEGNLNLRILDKSHSIQPHATAHVERNNIDIASSIVTKYIVAQVGDTYRAYVYSVVLGWLTLDSDEKGIHARPVEQDTFHDVSIVVGFNNEVDPTQPMSDIKLKGNEKSTDIDKIMETVVESPVCVVDPLTLDELSQFQNTHPGDTGRVPSVEERAANTSLRTQQPTSTKTPQETWTPQLSMFVNVVGCEEFNPEEVYIIEDCAWVTKCAYLRYTLRPLNSEKPYVDVRAEYVKPFKVPL